MTDNELLEKMKSGGPIVVPYFDGQALRIDLDIVPAEEALPALKRFLALSAENRRADARHLVAYCKLMMDAIGEEEALYDMDGTYPTLENIWAFASPKLLLVSKLDAGKYAARPTVYIQIEGSVAWEPEHGLQMSWADGDYLVKVGSFDGHPTNGHASAKPERDQYVFHCYRPDLCTFPDPK